MTVFSFFKKDHEAKSFHERTKEDETSETYFLSEKFEI